MQNRIVERYTLEDIISQRDNALKEVRESGKIISHKVRMLFAPPKATGKFDLLANNLDRIIAIYDGVLLGSKIIKRFRKFIIHR